MTKNTALCWVAMATMIALCDPAAAFAPAPAIPSSSTFASTKFKLNGFSLDAAKEPTSSSTDSRKRWDFVRFVRQSSRFVSLPFAPRAPSLTLDNVRPGDILWQQQGTNAFTMAPLDDVVMGGVSASRFEDRTGQWTGTVTDENNGGFVGIRSTPSFQWNMDNCAGLEWKLVFNGTKKRRFKFVLRDSTDFNGITWTTSVDLKPGKNTVRIPFQKQIPALFAKTVPDQVFQREHVVGVQIAYSKFEYDGDLNPNFAVGAVDLQLLELKAF